MFTFLVTTMHDLTYLSNGLGLPADLCTLIWNSMKANSRLGKILRIVYNEIQKFACDVAEMEDTESENELYCSGDSLFALYPVPGTPANIILYDIRMCDEAVPMVYLISTSGESNDLVRVESKIWYTRLKGHIIMRAFVLRTVQCLCDNFGWSGGYVEKQLHDSLPSKVQVKHDRNIRFVLSIARAGRVVVYLENDTPSYTFNDREMPMEQAVASLARALHLQTCRNFIEKIPKVFPQLKSGLEKKLGIERCCNEVRHELCNYTIRETSRDSSPKRARNEAVN